MFGKINEALLGGEYKLWIYKRYLVPSFHFLLAVHLISKSSISKLQKSDMRCMKSWLGLCRLTTITVVHHPDVSGAPTSLNSKLGQINFSASISSSQDPFIQNLTSLITDSCFLKRQGFHKEVGSILELARNSISSIVG